MAGRCPHASSSCHSSPRRGTSRPRSARSWPGSRRGCGTRSSSVSRARARRSPSRTSSRPRRSRRSSSHRTRPSRLSSTARCASCSRRTPSSTSSATTTTTSPRRTSPRATRTSTRTRSSTTRSTACATRRRGRCSRGATSSSSRPSAASTASAAPRATTASSSTLKVGEELRRDKLLRMLVDIQYERNDVDFHRGTFRVRGDVVEVFPAYEQETAIRIEFFGDDDRGHQGGRPAPRQGEGVARALRDLPGLALRHAAGADAPRDREHPRGAPRAARRSSTRRGASSRSSGSSSGRCTTSR